MELKKIKLKKLLADLPVKIMGNKDLEITGLSAHSKTVAPGHLFIAKSGMTHHGSCFVEEAIHGGAKAVLTDLYNPFCKELTQIICESPEALEGELAHRFFGNPSRDLFMVGITGTNGKTTTSYLTRTLLGEEECGLIGTIEYLFGKSSLPASFTTPDVITNHKMFARMKESGLKRCVMEVTSHALVQNRVDRISYDVALFTNLTRDHLDYHKSIEAYLQAKAKLFEGLEKDKVALINNDSPYALELVKNCKAEVKTYGIDHDAYYRAINVKLKRNKTSFTLCFEDRTYEIQTSLVGRFNVYNTLAAISIALEAKIPLETVLKRLNKLKAPKGRLESIPNQLKCQIFIDFAHTDDALKNVLETLKQTQHKKIITVFGCGGDRDQEKRPLMGKVVSSLSDVTIITSDNPRSEDPEKICEAIYEGCENKKNVSIEVDRRSALLKALKEARPGDIVLIAGRGHEMYQLIGHKRISFNDAQVVRELLSTL